MAKSVDLKLNIKPVTKLKGLLDECVGAAARLGDAMSRITPDLMAAYKDIGPDPLVSDMRTAVAICENEDHVTSMIGKSWLKALIQHRCSVVGMKDPFEDSKQRYEGADAFTVNKVVLVDPIPEEDQCPVVTDTWGPWTHPFGEGPGDLRQRSDAWLQVCALLDEVSPGWASSHKKGADAALDAIKGMCFRHNHGDDTNKTQAPSSKLEKAMAAQELNRLAAESNARDSNLVDADWWKGCAEPYGNGADAIEQRANAWTTVCHTITAINPAWRAGHKKVVDAAVEFIQQMSDPDFKEVPGKFTGEAVSFSVEGVGTFNIEADSSGALAVILENLDKPAMVEALNKHYGVSLLVPGEPVKELKPDMKPAGWQYLGADANWHTPHPDDVPSIFENAGHKIRHIYTHA